MDQLQARSQTPPPIQRDPQRKPPRVRSKYHPEARANQQRLANFYTLTKNGIDAEIARKVINTTVLGSFLYTNPMYLDQPLGYTFVHNIALEETNDAGISHKIACYMNRRPLNYQPPGE